MTKALPPRSIPPAPADLSPESQGDWPGLDADVTVTLGAAALDFSMLADVLRGRDRLAQVRDVLGREGLTVTGSKGQTRPHPLLITESVLRREVADGYKRLRLDGSARWRFDVTEGRITPWPMADSKKSSTTPRRKSGCCYAGAWPSWKRWPLTNLPRRPNPTWT